MTDSTERVRRSFVDFARGARGEPSRLWLGGAALLGLILGARAGTIGEGGQVAGGLNKNTGSTDVITQPGLITRLPFGIHDVYIIDVTPQTFHLRGTVNKSVLEARELDVRAADGSSFAFNDTTLLFRAIPAHGDQTLRDSGTGHAYYEWMLPYARAILRDEFGRESTISVSNPPSFARGEA